MNDQHTPGRLIPLRSHEDHRGSFIPIDLDDAEEVEYYQSRPFTKLVTEEGETVVTAHDLFEFRPGDAERLAACWNAFDGFTLDEIKNFEKTRRNP